MPTDCEDYSFPPGLHKRHGKDHGSHDEISSMSKLSLSSSSSSLASDVFETRATPTPLTDPVWSSGVPFYPPSSKYWRIGNEWYDFTDFAKKHPGGADVLYLSRDRFEDATFVFEAHHHNYKRARKIIQKYRLDASEAPTQRQILRRPVRLEKAQLSGRTHFDSYLDAKKTPDLLNDDAFYSVIRTRVAHYLKHEAKCPEGDPTWFCIAFFWSTFTLWCLLQWGVYQSGSFFLSIPAGFVSTWLGAFGHNWVHQPKYRKWGFATLSLDMVGFSSEAWWREHNLQHHMYTNTPWDNHFRGSDPFVKTDPTAERNWIQKHVMPRAIPILFCFALYVNYIVNTIFMFQGQERLSIGKFILPTHIYLMIYKWGLIHGVILMFIQHIVLGNYYFTLALMNHNTENTLQVGQRNSSKDWGIAQLHSSADWSCNLKFWQAGLYLWLNYHTVHHLFPRIDISHHPAISKILVWTCEEFGINYEASSFTKIYHEMINSFQNPHSLGSEIFVYAGGI